MDPKERDAQVNAHLSDIFTLVLQEAHTWHASDPEAEDLVTTAQHLADSHFPESKEELFVLLTLYRRALGRPTVPA